MGLPGLPARQATRVQRDNLAAEFLLGEVQRLHDRQAVSLRENPANSLHWSGPTEQRMWESGAWSEALYDSCCLHGVAACTALMGAKGECCPPTLPALGHFLDPCQLTMARVQLTSCGRHLEVALLHMGRHAKDAEDLSPHRRCAQA